MQFPDIRKPGQRRQVGGELHHSFDLGRRFVVPAKLDQRVDHDAVCRAVVGEGFDRRLTRIEGERELVASELEPAEPDEHQDVVWRELQGAPECGLGRGVQRRVGGLADPLQEREAEIALRGRIVRVRLRRAR